LCFFFVLCYLLLNPPLGRQNIKPLFLSRI
jgi:hypothetical protein